MEILDKLTDKLRRHVWCVIAFAVLLMFWIIAFSVTGKADNIAAWLSIVLSIIVIGYMFFQAYEMRNLIAEGHRVMVEKAGTMEQTAGTLAERAEAVEEASHSLLGALQPPEKVVATTTTPPPSQTFGFDASQSVPVVLLTLYTMVKSQEYNKPFDTFTIGSAISEATIPEIDMNTSSGRTSQQTITGMVVGVYEGLQCVFGRRRIPYRKVVDKDILLGVGKLPESITKHVVEILKARESRPIYPEKDIYLQRGAEVINDYFEKQQ